jgi:hypothetical protein
MEKNTKLITGLIIAILAVCALAIVPTVLAENNDTKNPYDFEQYQGLKHRRRCKPAWLRYILRKGEYTQLTGKFIAQKGPILVITTGEDSTVNVIVPPLWLVGDKIMNKTDLFDEDPFSAISDLELETLKAIYCKETHEITAYFVYGILSDGVEAKAILPFNIETTAG